MKHLTKLFTTLLLFTMFSAVGFATAQETNPEETTAQQETTNPPLTDLRNYRYCEIIPVYRERLTLRMEVFNTLSFNECPADLWETIDAETLKKDLGALQVVVNGPRYWVLDELVGEGGITSEGEMASFNGIDMALRGVLESSVMGSVVGEEFYTPNTISRSTSYTFYKNELVYLLVDPVQGDVYIMQSYSQGIDPNLSIGDLTTLGDRLELPEGWRYEAVRLSKDFVLSSGGQTTIINDEFASTYQRIPTQALIPNF